MSKKLLIVVAIVLGLALLMPFSIAVGSAKAFGTADMDSLNPVRWLANISIGSSAPNTYYYGYKNPTGSSKVEIHYTKGLCNQEGYLLILDLTNQGQISPPPTAIGSLYSMGLWISEFNTKVKNGRHIVEAQLGPGLLRPGTDVAVPCGIYTLDFQDDLMSIEFDSSNVKEFAVLINSRFYDALTDVRFLP